MKNQEFEAIRQWMLYCSNFASKPIGEYYAPEILKATNCPEHLAEKFFNICSRDSIANGTQALHHLWHELDGNNQELVVEWLMKNYKG